MLGLVGGADICVERVSEIEAKDSSEVEIMKLWPGEIELDRSLLLVCVTVSEFVSDSCSILPTEAASTDGCWLLSVEVPTDVLSPPSPQSINRTLLIIIIHCQAQRQRIHCWGVVRNWARGVRYRGCTWVRGRGRVGVSLTRPQEATAMVAAL